MSSVIIAIIIIAVGAGIPFILIQLIHYKNRKKKSALMAQFHEEGSRRSLSFSSTEQLKGSLFGFDGIRRSLLVLDYDNGYHFRQINLASVAKCSIRKEVDMISSDDPKEKKKEAHTRSIDLHFESNNGTASESICFYHINKNSLYEMSELEAKAVQWETIVRQLIGKGERVRA